MTVHAIHHVTAISGEARRVLDFYVGVLGMRLVKRTVNFDDPGAYHFYFGDEAGSPGSLFTVFPWANGRKGRVGAGQAAETALAIPPASLGFWLDRLAAHRVAHELPARRLATLGADGGETVVTFADPDGMRLALATDPRVADLPGWTAGGDAAIPAEHAIRGVFGVTLWVEDAAGAAGLLEGPMGWRRAGAEGTTTRLVADGAALGRVVDVRDVRGFWGAADGVGSVHHVAFRVADADAQRALTDAVTAAGVHATAVRDRQYFQSVYFRAPGGVLFELATDGPGFAVDEPLSALGESLRLPPQFEAHREAIAAALPTLEREPAGA
ncbi:ring-cleaving dioxygenase [Roseisolibacter sp. H3M3-2]|uniref:ring-cleaving dioxygenase n=1 Tax=Roseisolibacter sp. H3M3-2 TaxID=3031323 RepID=UPI0023DA96EC|nr:ring-cleaving dioxygenase [Roseisolibacter sp. H3M3-2]MDF1505864.1 ring-cleaving dioxygenase [Roseisolibacter sp. H3M3-2]